VSVLRRQDLLVGFADQVWYSGVDHWGIGVSARSTCCSPLAPPGCEKAGLERELSVAEAMVAAISRGESRFRCFQLRRRGQ
jgi:hypothetical protein